MKKLFERLANPGRSEPRLTLAAFGKHPGWDDHIPGIGLETETLADLKQTLYVEGIGGQIDSGAWEKLEVDKRYENFDHRFLWLWPDHLVLGLLWSSTDRKGRSKYPMVLCVEAQGVSPAFMVRAVMPGLCRLRDACRNTTSPQEVERLCGAAQEQLGKLLAGPARGEHPGFGSPEQRRAFIEHPENAPDGLGLLRLLHELSLVPSLVSGRANGGDAAAARASEHLRLPVAAPTTEDSVLLWGGFLVCAVADNVPVLMLSRAGETYLEAIVGKPDPGDFFCLQTTPAAQPLVTRIPYQLSPTAGQDLDAVLARFLDSKPAAPAPAAGSGVPSLPSPVTQEKETKTARRGYAKLLWAALAVLLIGGATAAVLLKRGGNLNASPKTNSPAPAPQPEKVSTNSPAAAQELEKAAAALARNFSEATNEAAQAFRSGDYSNALLKANLALTLHPDDTLAREIKRKANEALLIAREVGKSGELHQSLAKAKAADKAENWDLATRQYERVAQLSAETKDDTTAAEAKRAIEFTATMAAGQRAAESGDFRAALSQAEKALKLRPTASGPVQLKSLADAKMAEQEVAAQRQQAFVAATNAAGAALARKDLTNALAQVNKALTINPGEPSALRLRRAVGDAIDAHAQAERKKRLAQDLKNAGDSFAAGDYIQTLAICATQPDENDFKNLAANARYEQAALEAARIRLTAGDYVSLHSLKTNNCSSKPAFARIIAQGLKEEGQLATLNAARQTNGWEFVRERLASDGFTPVAAKQPFTELRAWAEQQAKAAATATPQPLDKLDETLECLLVNFKVLRPDAPNLTSVKARNEKPYAGSLPPTRKQQIQRSIDWLEQEFARGAWLDQNDRKRHLDELRERLKYWQ